MVNFDLPGRSFVSSSGLVALIASGRANADNILCYSFLPADGVERIIRLRAGVEAEGERGGRWD